MTSTGGIAKRLLAAGVTLLLMTSSLPPAEGHGRLLEPPSRSSMWRSGFNTPKNYDDNALNCGGLNTEWYVNHGKCGVCGDPWDQQAPRNNEAGGKYGNGIITRTYSTGQIIDVRVQITANHKGWFEFRMCVHNDPSTPITHDCLNQHLLELADGSGARYTIDPNARDVNLKLKLPDGVSCSQCVLQWKWHGGNNYGSIQEEFYGCSDIAIGASAATTPPPTVRPTNPPTRQSTSPPTRQPTSPPTRQPTAPPTLLPTTAQKVTPSPSTAIPGGGGQTGSGPCHATGQFIGVPDLERYCQEQCPLGNCPSAYCACSSLPATVTANPSVTLTPSSVATATPRITTAPPPTLLPTTRPQTPVITTTTQKVTPSPSTPGGGGQMGSGPCHATGQFQGVPDLERYCQEQCPLGNCPSAYCACSSLPATVTANPSVTLTPSSVATAMPTITTAPPRITTAPPKVTTKTPVRTTQPAPSTTSAPGQSGSHLQCHAVGVWQGIPELDLYCNEHCPKGDCPKQCSCTAVQSSSTQPPKITTTPPRNMPRPTTTRQIVPVTMKSTTAATTTTTTSTSSGPRCVAIGLWQGDVSKDQWCNANCPTLCPALSCRCGGPASATAAAHTTTLPATTAGASPAGSNPCRAVGPWAGDAMLDAWCKQTCSHYSGCDPQYCLCDGAGSGTTSSSTPSVPTTTTTLLTTSGVKCHAINGWAGNPDLDRHCERECNSGGLCPPEYCLCTNQAPNGAITTTTTGTTSPTCYAINSWAGIPDLDRQCDTQCKAGQCPPQYCACGPKSSTTSTTTTTTPSPGGSGSGGGQQGCRAVGSGQGVPEMDDWCRKQCAQGNCPHVYCAC